MMRYLKPHAALVALAALHVELNTFAAIQFDGSAHRHHYSFCCASHPQSADWTVMLRMRCASWKTGARGFGVIWSNWNQASRGADAVVITNSSTGVLTLQRITGGSSISSASTSALSINTNYEIQVAAAASGTAVFYVNNVLIGSVTMPASVPYDDWYFGGGNGQASDCQWEAAKYWSTKLNPAELNAETNSLTAVKTANLWDTWRFTSHQSTTYTGAVNSRPLTNQSTNDTYVASDLVPPTAPFVSAGTPSGTIGTLTTATIGATTDISSSGTFYAVVDSSANLSGVTASQVKAGQKASGASALTSCSVAVSTTTPSCGVTGLSAGTAYAYAIIHNTTNGDSNLLTGTLTTANGGETAGAVFTHHLMQRTIQ